MLFAVVSNIFLKYFELTMAH